MPRIYVTDDKHTNILSFGLCRTADATITMERKGGVSHQLRGAHFLNAQDTCKSTIKALVCKIRDLKLLGSISVISTSV